jgi:hypothetical protein
MDKFEVVRFLEILEDTCFPIQIDWNKQDLYVKGFLEACEKHEKLERERDNESSN